jgi:hypothetical protein
MLRVTAGAIRTTRQNPAVVQTATHNSYQLQFHCCNCGVGSDTSGMTPNSLRMSINAHFIHYSYAMCVYYNLICEHQKSRNDVGNEHCTEIRRFVTLFLVRRV